MDKSLSFLAFPLLLGAAVIAAAASSSGPRSASRAVLAQAQVYSADSSLPDGIACDKISKACVYVSKSDCNTCTQDVQTVDGGFLVSQIAKCTVLFCDHRQFIPAKPKKASSSSSRKP